MAEKAMKAIFNDIIDDIRFRRIEKVFEAVNENNSLAKTFVYPRTTLLIEVCNGPTDSLELVKLLVNYGANIYEKGYLNSNSLNCAEWKGHIKICTFLLEHGVYTKYEYFKTFSNACNNGHLQVCLLLISRCMKQIMMNRHCRKEIDEYGICLFSGRSLDEKNETDKEREILLNAFNDAFIIEEIWARRLPLMDVVVGCGFRPLAKKLHELKLQRDALSVMGIY